MASDFHSFEVSLKEYLTDAQNDRYNSRNTNLYKYNNLKILMEPRKHSTPHFIIRIGISEAVYDLEKAEKISGGLGSDERIIRRWLDRNFKNMNIESIWKKACKPKTVVMKKDSDYDDDDD